MHTETTTTDPGMRLVMRERMEQLEKHGFSPEQDDTHVNEELLEAAVCILQEDDARWPKSMPKDLFIKISEKPTAERLAVGAALVAAEISRIIRAQQRTNGEVPAVTLPAKGSHATVRDDVFDIAIAAGVPVNEAELLSTVAGLKGTIVECESEEVSISVYPRITVVFRLEGFHGNNTVRLPLKALRFIGTEPKTTA